MSTPILAIDFGTSCTSAGLLVGDRVELAQDRGDDVVPSVVYAPARSSHEAGRRALMRGVGDPAGVVRSIKRILGVAAGSPAARGYAARAPFAVNTVGGRLALKLRSGDHAPEQIVGMLLDYLRRLAERRFDCAISKAVVTTPAVAPAGYHDALTRAARIAHLDVVATAPEPIAAALGAGLHDDEVDRRVLICDFGGASFDVSALIQRGLRFTTLASHSDAALGGEDLDLALAEGLATMIMRSSGYDMHCDLARWNELVQCCESAKCTLTSQLDAPIEMTDAYVAGGVRRDFTVAVDRAWAERCWRPLMARAQQTVNELLALARWRAGEVDRVVLVGGSAQVPMFGRAIEELFPGRVGLAPRANVAVAVGATLLTPRFAATRAVPGFERMSA